MPASSSRRRDRPFAPGYYNLWQGFAVEPREGDCSKFLAHIKDNVARGDEATFLWIVGWWAQIFQQPSIKMETALVLRGPFGTGKTKIGRGVRLAARRPLPAGRRASLHHRPVQLSHGVAAGAARRRGVLGRRQGDRGHAEGPGDGRGPHARVQGCRSDCIKNFIRLFVTGNPDWMVPAGFRDRRWAVFDIGEDTMQDNAYFAAIDRRDGQRRPRGAAAPPAQLRSQPGQPARHSEDRGAARPADREHERGTGMVVRDADARELPPRPRGINEAERLPEG